MKAEGMRWGVENTLAVDDDFYEEGEHGTESAVADRMGRKFLCGVGWG